MLEFLRKELRINLVEGDEFPIYQWCAFGRIVPMVGDWVRSYFFIKLPSYQWMRDGCWDQYMWHQAALLHTGNVGRPSDSPFDGWRIAHFPMRDASGPD